MGSADELAIFLLNKYSIAYSSLRMEQIPGGLTNTVYLVIIDEQPKHILRINGLGTSKLIDRKSEKNAIGLAATHGICPYYLEFSTDYMMQYYAEGITLDTRAMDNESLQRIVAKKLSDLHSIEIAEHSELWLPKILEKYVEELGDEQLRKPLGYLLEQLEVQNSPVALCHNDLRLNNIVFNSQKESATFLDFEYAASNYTYFDIAHYFWQHDGAEKKEDFRRLSYPMRTHFIEAYLSGSGGVYNHSTNELCLRKIVWFEASTHFLWSLWARIQAKHSTNNFDYYKYSCARWECYEKCLESAMLGLYK